MKTLKILVVLLFVHTLSVGQNRTFQGGIVGISPGFIHLQPSSGQRVTGFFKFPSDDQIVQLEGVLDNAGKLTMKGDGKELFLFSATLRNRTLEGTIILPENADTLTIYGVDLRGEYYNDCHDMFSITLSDEGYVMRNVMRGQQYGRVIMSRGHNGRIFLRCDELEALLWVKEDSLVVITHADRPLFMGVPEHCSVQGLVFTATHEYFSGDSLVEFPERSHEQPANEVVFGEHNVLRIRPIARSEFVARKWAHRRPELYEEITNFAEAAQMLGERMRIVETPDENGSRKQVQITFSDGKKKMWDYFPDGEVFVSGFLAYFPGPDILLFENEAAGEEFVDLSDSSNWEYVGDPRYYAVTPDGQWRLSRYYPGGAADDSTYFMERWNEVNKRYEFAEDLPFSYVEEWFWVDNNRASIRSYDRCCEMEVMDYVR